MRNTTVQSIAAVLLLTAPCLQADELRGGISMEFVSIGNPGNAPDTYLYNSVSYSRGRVDYFYRIGRYEVTEAQWAKFLAASQLHTSPLNNRDEGFDDPLTWGSPAKPKVHLSWYHAAQFCNWLTSGDTRNGAYQFDPATGALTGINRASAKTEYGVVFVLPSVDEWYKAAYFKADGSGFSLYANGTSTPPRVYDDSNYPGTTSTFNPVWDVGTGVEEQNGTYDMMGNVWEWMEEARDGSFNSAGENMGLLGGSAHWVDALRIRAQTGFIKDQYADDPESWIGFRVAVLGPHCPQVFLNLSDGIKVEFDSYAGTEYTVEASDDMLSWTPAVTGILGDGSRKSISFIDVFPALYFRVKSREL